MSLDRARRAHLTLDGSSCRVAIESVANATLIERLGGIGRALPWFEAHTGRTPDPLVPGAPLYVNVGAFTGSRVMTGLRTYFTAYSPLKRSVRDDPGILWSAASGNLGPEIAATGVTDLVLTGRLDQPSVLVLEGGGGELRARLVDGAPLVGKTTREKVAALVPEFPDFHFAVVGPAGEHAVRYACIACSTDRQTRKGGKFMRFAGRGGMGAVLASKNVLAVAVRGADRAQRDFPRDLLQPLNRKIARGEETAKYRDFGTWRYNMEVLSSPRGGLPVHNFREANHPDARRLTGEVVERTHPVTDENCVQCGIRCWKIVGAPDGTPLAKVDYEPAGLFGPNLGIFDIAQVADLIDLGDELGFDAISMGGVLGFLMEHEREGLRFGDHAGARRVMSDTAHGRLPLPALGVKALGERLGKTDTAMHVHGLELAAYLGNTDPAAALALAGNHMSMATYGLAGKMGRDTLEEWVEAVPTVGLATLLHDMSGVCKFGKVSKSDHAALLGALGESVTPDDLAAACIEVYKVGRRIDARQGFTAADDVLPGRCFERLPGQGVQQFNTREFFDAFKARVYERLGLGAAEGAAPP